MVTLSIAGLIRCISLDWFSVNSDPITQIFKSMMGKLNVIYFKIKISYRV